MGFERGALILFEKRLMNTLQRYLFKEFFTASLFTVGIFVFVLLVGNALKDVLTLLASGKISWSLFFDVLLHLTPSLVAYALPLGVLTGTLLVLGKLSSHNEIMAMKASGISLMSIVSPLFFLAILCTFFAMAVNFYFGPKAITYYRSCLANVIRKNPLEFIQAGTFVKDFPSYIFYIGSKRNGWIENCWLWELDGSQASGVNVFLHASSGYLRYEKDRDALVLTLLNGTGEKWGGIKPDQVPPQVLFKETSIALPLKEILGAPTTIKRFDYMTLSELLVEHGKVYRARLPSPDHARKIVIQLEIQKIMVMSFAVLSLLFIAIPLGIKVGRAETSANLVLAVGLALGYYFIVMALSLLEEKTHWRPDLFIWLPNFAFQGLGLFLLNRLSKH